MNIQRESISDTRVKLTITLDQSELADGEAVALTKLAKDVSAPGFRKGKVPVDVARKHVKPELLAQETLENAVSKAVAEAFTSEDIRALERPEVEVTKFVPGQEAEFTAEADIIPPVKLGNYKKLSAPKTSAKKIETSDVDDTIGRIKQQLAEKKSVDRAAKDGDEATIDFVGKKDGEAFDGGTGSDHPLVLGSNSFIPGFEEQIVGHKTGETFDINVTFPGDYHAKDLAGQEVTFETTIKDLKEVVEPEESDELAAKAGPFTTMDELRADIERELKAQAEREHEEAVRDHYVEQLVAKSDIPVPAILRQDQVEAIERDMTQNLMYQGLSIDQYVEQKGFASKEEWIEKEVGPLAESRVKAGLALSELSKVESITSNNEELAERVAAMKEQYAKQPEMAKRFDEPEIQHELANRILTEKTIDHLVALNTK